MKKRRVRRFRRKSGKSRFWGRVRAVAKKRGNFRNYVYRNKSRCFVSHNTGSTFIELPNALRYVNNPDYLHEVAWDFFSFVNCETDERLARIRSEFYVGKIKKVVFKLWDFVLNRRILTNNRTQSESVSIDNVVYDRTSRRKAAVLFGHNFETEKRNTDVDLVSGNYVVKDLIDSKAFRSRLHIVPIGRKKMLQFSYYPKMRKYVSTNDYIGKSNVKIDDITKAGDNMTLTPRLFIGVMKDGLEPNAKPITATDVNSVSMSVDHLSCNLSVSVHFACKDRRLQHECFVDIGPDAQPILEYKNDLMYLADILKSKRDRKKWLPVEPAPEVEYPVSVD